MDFGSISLSRVLERTTAFVMTDCLKHVSSSGTVRGERAKCRPSDLEISNCSLCFTRKSLTVADHRPLKKWKTMKTGRPVICILAASSRIVMQAISSGCGVEN